MPRWHQFFIQKPLEERKSRPAERICWQGIPRGRVKWWASLMGRWRRMLTGQKRLQVSASTRKTLAARRQQQQGLGGETDPAWWAPPRSCSQSERWLLRRQRKAPEAWRMERFARGWWGRCDSAFAPASPAGSHSLRAPAERAWVGVVWQQGRTWNPSRVPIWSVSWRFDTSEPENCSFCSKGSTWEFSKPFARMIF